MTPKQTLFSALSATALFLGCNAEGGLTDPSGPGQLEAVHTGGFDHELRTYLARHGFAGRVGSTLDSRLGRPLDRTLADLGRLLWFDPITSLNGDNACAGCHSPTNGFGDTQSIAIGIGNNGVVGPDRRGPRNQRRSPMVINTAFFPALMWNSRFASLSGDPFDNSAGFMFPAPEGSSLSNLPHLLVAQAFIPPTERVEMAGFHFPGDNDDIRHEVLSRLNGSTAYRRLFGRAFPRIKQGLPIGFDHFATAIAEFEFSLVFADAPIDRFARGESHALSDDQKQGALLFFGRAGCVRCHAVAGQSNEMFSDFRQHVIGVPQISPAESNVAFDGSGANEDFGLEQITGNPADRYRFRTSPLRNVALQPAFMHNGAFVRLEDAVRHHLDVLGSAGSYSPGELAADLRLLGPIEPVLRRLDPLLRGPLPLTEPEFTRLVEFVRDGLLDPAARPELLRHLVPHALPSRQAPHAFQF